MTELLSDIETPSDAELISRVRGGDVAAYGELFARHKDAANRLGRQLARGPDVDDLVAEAFAKVLQVLQGGGGPDIAFRAYLLTSVRRLHVDRVRATSKLQTSDDMSQFDPGIPFQDTAVADFENGAAAKAFASLPERWQLVLWHLEVEGQKPADIAPLLGMSPNSVSALAYRAREGLRQAFLTMHLANTSADDCRWVNEHLGAYVRKGLSRRDATKVEGHLDECRRCMAMYLELTEVNSNLAGIIAPLLLGAAAAGYCASTGTAVGITSVSALIGRARDFVAANAGASTAGAVAAGVAAVATAGVMVLGPDTARVISADQPITETTSLPNSGLAPAVDPPVELEELEERTTPERREASDQETADVSGDTLDEPESLDDPVLDIPVAVPGDVDGAPDGDTGDPLDPQPGDGPGSDGPGTDGPGSDGPGADGPGDPGTDGPGTDEPGTDRPGGPGTDGPGTDEPGTDEPGEDPPPTNPGPGPEENPGSDSPPSTPEEDDTDEPDGEQPPPEDDDAPGGSDPGNGDTGEDDGSSDEDDSEDDETDETSEETEDPGGGTEEPPSEGGGHPATLSVETGVEVLVGEYGANTTLTLTIGDVPEGTHRIAVAITSTETRLLGVDLGDVDCAQLGVLYECTLQSDGSITLELQLPPGKSGDGDVVTVSLLALSVSGETVATGTTSLPVDTSPPNDTGGSPPEGTSPSSDGKKPQSPSDGGSSDPVTTIVQAVDELL